MKIEENLTEERETEERRSGERRNERRKSGGFKIDSSFLTRTISGVILVAAAVLLILLGGPYLAAASCALSLIGMREFFRAAKVAGEPFTVPEFIAYLGAAGYYALLYYGKSSLLIPELALTCVAVLAAMVIRYPLYDTETVTKTLFGVFYVAVLFSFIFLIRGRFRGKIEVWLVFFSSWGADTCAYLVGRKLGKHRLSPHLSPKKSIEGAIGGLAGAALLGLIFALIFKQSIAVYMLICAVCAVISMIGDLAASAFKRFAGIKDYGHWIPGHGGFLDRFDSVLFTAPAVYLLAVLLL